MLTFTSVFPGCYDGRWPHAHFEVALDGDGIFGDGHDTQLAETSGSGSAGYTATLTVPVTTP